MESCTKVQLSMAIRKAKGRTTTPIRMCLLVPGKQTRNTWVVTPMQTVHISKVSSRTTTCHSEQ